MIFYTNPHLKDRLDIHFTACLGELLPEEAPTLFTVSDAYRQFAGQTQLLRSESRSRIKYLIRTNNIIVLNSYFNLTIKSNLTNRRDLIRFFDNLVVECFLVPPCKRTFSVLFPLYCINNQHNFKGLGQNHHISRHDKTQFCPCRLDLPVE